MQSRLQPVDMAFSKLKTLLRRAACRPINGLWSAIGCFVDGNMPDERANFSAAEYEPDKTENASDVIAR